ncbi:MAG: hypothetical protein HY097_07370 [Nitrospinae bacterium]|nr:hypothetical protein [Nitrospinota bacterium]MBI3815281.1 hypothetical protein [Nitrospinota bacterium]
MTDLKCPICSNTSIKPPTIEVAGKKYDCGICGAFLIAVPAEETLKNKSCDYKLSAWIREHHEFKREPPKITTYILEDVLKNFPDHKVSEKQTLLMRAIERRTDYPGAEVRINDQDYPLAWAKNYEELKFIIRSLKERGFIYINDANEDRLNIGFVQTKILPNGWDYLDKLTITCLHKSGICCYVI